MPVVVVFTKCDVLCATAFGKLKPDERRLPPEQQIMKVEEYAQGMLRDSTAWERLRTRNYPPKDYVHLESKYLVLSVVAWFILLLYRHAHL